MYYVLWDRERQMVVSGPQNVAPSDKWVPYYHGKRNNMTDVLVDFWDEDRQVVTQRCEENTSWLISRVDAYPPINKQLEALYDDIQNNTLTESGSFFKMINDVKNKVPK